MSSGDSGSAPATEGPDRETYVLGLIEVPIIDEGWSIEKVEAIEPYGSVSPSRFVALKSGVFGRTNLSDVIELEDLGVIPVSKPEPTSAYSTFPHTSLPTPEPPKLLGRVYLAPVVDAGPCDKLSIKGVRLTLRKGDKTITGNQYASIEAVPNKEFCPSAASEDPSTSR